MGAFNPVSTPLTAWCVESGHVNSQFCFSWWFLFVIDGLFTPSIIDKFMIELAFSVDQLQSFVCGLVL